ncbi:hypothetical protein GLOIN_2v1484907 [Rhizophagus irregularis DAOM 181602=DAOM 197198]|nr:hypothetical protein GLOIN_2v1484907 [Rhizophagus irregularis DAOM 181602=DAOM 197198]
MGHRSVLHYQSVTARRAKNIPCNTGTEDEHDRFYLTVLPLNYAMVLGNTWRVLLRNVFLSCDAVIVSILRSSSSNNVFDIFILCIPEWVHFGVATREKPVESDILTILMGLTKDGVLTTTNPQ